MFCQVYTSRKIKEIKVREDKLRLASQQWVVYSFQCGLCDAGYMYVSCQHQHRQIEEHKGSAIGNHLIEQHDMELEHIAQSFRILRKCQNTYLTFEMFVIKEWKPSVQFNSRQTICLEQFFLMYDFFIFSIVNF